MIHCGRFYHCLVNTRLGHVTCLGQRNVEMSESMSVLSEDFKTHYKFEENQTQCLRFQGNQGSQRRPVILSVQEGEGKV